MFFWSARTAPAISTVAPKASIVYYPLDSSRHNLRRDGHQQGGQRDGRSNSRDLHPAPASTIPVMPMICSSAGFMPFVNGGWRS